MFDFTMTQFSTFYGASETLLSYSIFSYTEDSFTFAACHGNRKHDLDGAAAADDDDDNDDDGDDDDGICLRTCKNP